MDDAYSRVDVTEDRASLRGRLSAVLDAKRWVTAAQRALHAATSYTNRKPSFSYPTSVLVEDGQTIGYYQAQLAHLKKTEIRPTCRNLSQMESAAEAMLRIAERRDAVREGQRAKRARRGGGAPVRKRAKE